MPYTAGQIGEIAIYPITNRSKDRYSLVLVQHGRTPGIDETHIAVAEPIGWQEGRDRTIGMIARGVDPADIRFAEAPAGVSDTDGLVLRPCDQALWWTRGDLAQAKALDITPQEYAQRLHDRRAGARAARQGARQAPREKGSESVGR